jgi:hypothetical protein
MWPDFMPGDPERNNKTEWNPFDNDNSGSRGGSPFDRFNREKTDMFGNHIPDNEREDWYENQREKQGMPRHIAAGPKTKGDKGKEKNSTKRGFWQGFLHPDGTSSGTAPSTIVGGESLVMNAAGGIAKSEAAAASTTKAASTALSSAKIAKVFSKGVGSINVIVTVFEGFADGKGFTWGDGGKVAVAIVEVAGSWVISVVDIATYAITGASVSERIGSGIDNIK